MALKDVIIGYAKGDKGDKGDTGERGATGQTGPQGEPGNIADAAITDTQGLDVAKGAKTTAQKLFDAIADRIVNKLVTNDTLTTKLADYLLKSAMSSTNIDSTTNVPTSALVYSLMQDVNNNLGNGVFKALTFSDFSTSDDIKLACQKMFSALQTSGVCYRVRMKPTPSGTTADAYVYCASSNYGFVHIRDHGGTDYYGRVQNGTWTWDSYALKSALDSRASCDSWVTDLDSAPKAIILRTNTDPTGYPTNLGGNSCLAFQLNPGTKYSAQLAFSFSKDRLAIRRKNNSDTWTAWKYVDFTIS